MTINDKIIVGADLFFAIVFTFFAFLMATQAVWFAVVLWSGLVLWQIKNAVVYVKTSKTEHEK